MQVQRKNFLDFCCMFSGSDFDEERMTSDNMRWQGLIDGVVRAEFTFDKALHERDVDDGENMGSYWLLDM